MKISSIPFIVAVLFLGCSTPLAKLSGKGAKWQGTIKLQSESPLDQVIEVGGTANFAVSAKSDETSFQWLYGCDPIPGATNTSLTVYPVTTNNVGYYTCVAYRGLDLQMGEPMQLISMQKVGTNMIILGAKPPPALGGTVLLSGQGQLLEGRRPQTGLKQNEHHAEPVNAPGSIGVAPVFAGGLVSVSQFAMLMSSPTNVSGSVPYIGSTYTLNCPNPYSGYVRFTAGWYPRPASAWRARALWSSSAIVFDDRYRSACTPSGNFDLSGYGLYTNRLHRFVGYFAPGSPPSAGTTYLLELTGFYL